MGGDLILNFGITDHTAPYVTDPICRLLSGCFPQRGPESCPDHLRPASGADQHEATGGAAVPRPADRHHRAQAPAAVGGQGRGHEGSAGVTAGRPRSLTSTGRRPAEIVS